MESSPPAAPASRVWWHLFALVAVTIALYANSLGNGFVSDDDFQVLANPQITSFDHAGEFFTSNVWAFAQSESTNYYRPLFMLLYAVEYAMFGYAPFGWHAFNLACHIAALLAVYFLVRALAMKLDRESSASAGRSSAVNGEPLAFLAALWFALHPVHVEAVVWVAVLTDLVCGLALFLGTLAWHRAREGAAPALNYSLVAVCYLAGLLMKETAILFPALLLAYEFFYRRESIVSILRAALRFLPCAAVLAIYVPLRLKALGTFAPSSGAYHKVTPWEMFLSIPVLAAEYVVKLFLPFNLNYYHLYEPVRNLDWRTPASLALLAGLIVLMFWWRRRQPLLAFALAWFFLTLAPVLSIPNVGENVFTERYLYIPSLGFCVIAAHGWFAARRRAAALTEKGARASAIRNVLAAGLAALFLFYAVQTIRRNPDFRDDLTLFTRTAAQSPGSATIQMNLGYIHWLHGRVDTAIEHYERSLALDPNRALTHNNLGNALTHKGQFDKAEFHLKRATELRQKYHAAWLNLGLLYAAQKRWDDAIAAYRRAIELRANFVEAWTALGLALWNKGEAEPAIAAYRKAVELRPDYPEARINLGSALSETGRGDEALEHLQAALRANPAGPHAGVIHYNLGVIYERKQQWRYALAEYERAYAANPAMPGLREKIASLRPRVPAETLR